ncbi:hypothetical protein CANARDRAFT_5026 [[Candida] arabinofermentans NRRL YB-2248]|uniref:Uncharacterized protein n=1 Tax=[Candida] arabinofermentans NRRL YB-2248 TaxID=983967 RepID=A0A1E4T7L8_9ASCO|nr:hypothetical protein CANARDRAFT_5026 [[Candida] arabinofermentans NRRL YB-2248]
MISSTNVELQKLSNQLSKRKPFLDTSSNKTDFQYSNRLNEPSMKLKSNYWKIDNSNLSDDFDSLTSISVNKSLTAVGSNANSENLKIYNLNQSNNFLTHLTSITLPNIHSLKWLDNVIGDDDVDDDGESIDFLLSGHANGIANLTMIPNVSSPTFTNAEIIKRFNHEKHLTVDYDNSIKISNLNKPTNVIYQIDTTPTSWKTCNKNSLLSIYKENVFLWDTSRSSYPILKNKIKGLSSFSANPKQDGLLSLGGSFGISLFDMRSSSTTGYASSSFYIPHKKNVETSLTCWCKEDPNYLVASTMSNELQVWDIRSLNPIITLTAHADEITSLIWTKFDTLYSSSKDGKIIQWDLSNVKLNSQSGDMIKGSLKNGFNLDPAVSEIGTMIPASNNSIIAMVSVTNPDIAVDDDDHTRVLSLDNSFIGLHSQIQEDSVPPPVRRFSNETLFEEEVVEQSKEEEEEEEEEYPLYFSPARKPRFHVTTREFSDSSETLASPATTFNSKFSPSLSNKSSMGTLATPETSKIKQSFESSRDFDNLNDIKLKSILEQLKTTIIDDQIYF